MARLIYSAITSLDGYFEDKDGNFDWAAPDEEVPRFFNNLFVIPILVGGGKRSLPDNALVMLKLLNDNRFGNGVIHLHYLVKL